MQVFHSTATPPLSGSTGKRPFPVAANETAPPTATLGQILDSYFGQLISDVRAAVREEMGQQRPALAADTGDAEKLLTPEQTAELLGVCRQTVFDWAKRGLLIAHRLSRRTFFKRGEVMAALQSQQQPTGRRKYARKTR
jgi:excisionase family DNA binding protein